MNSILLIVFLINFTSSCECCSRRDDSYWNGNKKIHSESDARLNQGSNYNRQHNRFSTFEQKDRGRFPAAAVEQPNTYDRYHATL